MLAAVDFEALVLCCLLVDFEAEILLDLLGSVPETEFVK